MKKIRNFRDLVVWQKSHELFLRLAGDVEGFPGGIVSKVIADQVIRSSGSISANLAEGFGRRQGKEYVHYLIISRGSTTETWNWLMKCRDLGWIEAEEFGYYESVVEEILKMLNKMIGQKLNH